jgi:hypothetical protein
MTTDQIRHFILEAYVEPARRSGLLKVRVVAGEVHRRLGLRDRLPMVCNALRIPLKGSGVKIASQEGPPSGQSSTLAVVYELQPEACSESGEHARLRPMNPLIALRGAAKELFRELGGGEEFLRGEREQFFPQRDDQG